MRAGPAEAALFAAMVGVAAGAQAAGDSYWHCAEIESVGLRYHYGQWTQQQFKVASHLVKQSGVQLDLAAFGMLPQTTECAYDAAVTIISCTDRYTLFNLNIVTGNAVMSYVRGWVDQRGEGGAVSSDLGVSAVRCRPLAAPPAHDPRRPQPAGPGAGVAR